MPQPNRQFALKDASRRWWILLSLLIAGFLYVYVSSEPEKQHRFAGQTMGTTYSVVLGEPQRPEDLNALRKDAEKLLARVNRSMSTYDPSSEITRFNNVRSTEPVSISAPFAEVVRISLEVAEKSEGSFDITVGPLVNAWGFGPQRRPKKALSPERLADIRKYVGYDKLELDEQSLRKTHPRVEIDLSGVAKGYGVDVLADMLAARGIQNYLVEIGGEIRARGANVAGHPFRVGIEEPDRDTRSVRMAITVGNRALATSGNYRNYFELDGQRYVHTLDPADAMPVRHTLLSASVVADTCALADAWATALMAAGPEKAWRLVQENDLTALLLIAGPDNTIVERATDDFQELVVSG